MSKSVLGLAYLAAMSVAKICVPTKNIKGLGACPLLTIGWFLLLICLLIVNLVFLTLMKHCLLTIAYDWLVL